MFGKILDEHKIAYKINEPMSAHTSFKIGGEAEYFVEPASSSELLSVLSAAEELGIPVTLTGNGSNLLVSDGGIEGAVISTLKMNKITLLDENRIFAEAGASLTALCLFAKEQGLSGLEFAYGIPGSVGGAVFMNAGAYGGDMSQVTESVESISGDAVISRGAEELSLSYRHSAYTDNGEIIVGAVFTLSKGDRAEISEKMDTLMQKRKTSQPLDFPSAGSTFKRPEGYFAAALIDECGLKGAAVGGAEVSRKHAGFVINRQNATCSDVLALIEKIKAEVFRKKGVRLETEVIFTGKRQYGSRVSFTSDVKKELSAKRPSDRHAEAEAFGMLFLSRSFSFNKIVLQTGSGDTAECFAALLRRVFDITAEITEGGTSRPTYTVTVKNEAERKRILYSLGFRFEEKPTLKAELLKTEGSIGAFIRGAFLAGGSMSDPEREYRMDFSFRVRQDAEAFALLLEGRGIIGKITERAGRFILYIKDSNMLEDLLTVMGASNETLNLINVKIYKSMKNKINRKNNCETRNILKSADAAYEQTVAIKKLKKAGRLELMSEELIEAAALRAANPSASLSELCRISENRLTRSGLNHRLRRIIELSKEV